MQSLPKMISGPIKKKIVPARKIRKKTIIPIENKASKQPPFDSASFDDCRIDPVRPATPSIKNKREVR